MSQPGRYKVATEARSWLFWKVGTVLAFFVHVATCQAEIQTQDTWLKSPWPSLKVFTAPTILLVITSFSKCYIVGVNKFSLQLYV